MEIISTSPEKFRLEPEFVKRENCTEGIITSHLITIFKFLGWAWIIPYKIEYSKRNSKYEVHSNNFKKVSTNQSELFTEYSHSKATIKYLTLLYYHIPS